MDSNCQISRNNLKLVFYLYKKAENIQPLFYYSEQTVKHVNTLNESIFTEKSLFLNPVSRT